ncbi:uncharacterized protein M421DRAFT_59724 [Didymella exigua CBS 183.55]|uniref:Uncharacterized protein n=1 Tax=Didymella exigua CBS 183.55 TaxID=1150837 RepID=A0A6A5RQJ0_9PLEO|nr:uncharacterized protein M421DRAFT_59724 [Didymella exigua CBS 183.55]KAF1929929.1 hypothetical protein M421DRAFT_59724 [Didymella exigua CBS 183.55]
MDKSTPLHGSESNVRPYSIFIAYMITCLSLAVSIIIKLFEKTEKLHASAPSRLPQRKHVLLFSALAACSLLSTWSYMLRYFQWSYDNWLTVQSQHEIDLSVKHWGLWLKETSLFREAWESVIIGHNRYWWSHQIFYFACALGLHSERKGARQGISYTWAFILLGQIVAISFATNLYFLTLLLTPQQQQLSTPGPEKSVSRKLKSAPVSGYRKWFGPWLIDGLSVWVNGAAANALSWDKYQNGAPGFMQILLLPHVALMLLPTLRAILPEKFFLIGDTTTVNKIYRFLWFLNTQFFGQLVYTTFKAYRDGNLGGIRDALLEHPAVSSVGFDVIFCWISWICWWRTQDHTTWFLMPDL